MDTQQNSWKNHKRNDAQKKVFLHFYCSWCVVKSISRSTKRSLLSPFDKDEERERREDDIEQKQKTETATNSIEKYNDRNHLNPHKFGDVFVFRNFKKFESYNSKTDTLAFAEAHRPKKRRERKGDGEKFPVRLCVNLRVCFSIFRLLSFHFANVKLFARQLPATIPTESRTKTCNIISGYSFRRRRHRLDT